jgi:hypothetical protein
MPKDRARVALAVRTGAMQASTSRAIGFSKMEAKLLDKLLDELLA